MTIKRDQIIPIFLAAASGLLLTAAFPNIGLSICAWFALVPFLAAVKDRRPLDAFRLGFIMGVVHFISLCYWIEFTMRAYGNLDLWVSIPVLVLMASYLALYPAVFGMALARFCKTPAASLWMVPALWVVLEFGRTHLFSGFPWALLGYSQFKILPLIQIADTTGVYGVSFLIGFVNMALLGILLYFRKQAWKGRWINRPQAVGAVILALLLMVSVWGYGQYRIRQTDAQIKASKHVKIAVVQGNIDQAQKWDPAYQALTVKKYLRLSAQTKAAEPELIVWPETATPFYFLSNKRLSKLTLDSIKQNQTDFLIGSPAYLRQKERTRYLNSSYLVLADGTIAGRYDKAKLVPFGEYVPFKRWLPFLDKIVAAAGDFKPGRGGVPLVWQGHRIGPQICYEIIFPQLARNMVQNKAELIINVTNDAWYGRSSAPYQFFSMVVFRAVECRRAVVRAANTGISGFVDPVGRTHKETKIFSDAAVTHAVPFMHGLSPYVRIGDLFAWGCLLAVAVMAAIQRFRKTSRSKP
jgi:apolipoprotein N-acyltransferase